MMKKRRMLPRRCLAFLLAAAFMVCGLAGCTEKDDEGEKIRDLEFTVIAEADAPEEVRTLVSEKKTKPFKLTYTDDANLYIVVGYGPQQTGGYSIAVEELYLTENAIVVDTELLGPKKGEPAAPETSYPVIIIKTELLDYPVIFE